MTEFKKHGFWEGHNFITKEEVNNEGVTIRTTYCSKCGEVEGESARKKLSVELPIYVCTAPFGILSRDLSGVFAGQTSGFLTFNSGNITGSFNTNLEELYIVKYLEGNLLKTMKFDAEDTELIVDGKFCISYIEDIIYHKKEGKWIEGYHWKHDHKSSLKIHIPELPKLGSTSIEKIPLMTQSVLVVKKEDKQ